MKQLLENDPIRAAYHIALLEEPYSDHVRWYTHRGADGAADSAAAVYALNQPPIVFLIGSADGAGDCLQQAQLPQLVYSAYFPEHEQTLALRYITSRPTAMQRMVLTRETFDMLAPGQDKFRRKAVVLRGRHAALLAELYSCAPGFRPDPYQFSCGRYLGIMLDGRLAAAAGTHFISEQYSFAMAGNVLTRPDLRRRGYARAIMLSLLDRLFQNVETVCLNVGSLNAAAENLYRSLGFTAHCAYREGVSVLRGSLEPAPAYAANAR